jgi:hypothetical protein
MEPVYDTLRAVLPELEEVCRLAGQEIVEPIQHGNPIRLTIASTRLATVADALRYKEGEMRSDDEMDSGGEAGSEPDEDEAMSVDADQSED